VHQQARTEGETEALGAQLARARPPGQALAVIFLSGELGAGKTTLARGFLRACGFAGAVRSPTYTLVELYALHGLTIVHADLYRLRDPAELDTLGLRDWAQPGHLWLIEWPEQGAGHLPAPDLSIQLTIGRQAHALELAAHSELGRHWLQDLQRG